MLFTIVCHDKPGHLDLRKRVRPQHLAYVQGAADRLSIAGPLLDEAGDACGSLLVVDCPDRAAAEAFAAADPYAAAGLFAATAIHAFRTVFKDGAAL